MLHVSTLVLGHHQEHDDYRLSLIELRLNSEEELHNFSYKQSAGEYTAYEIIPHTAIGRANQYGIVKKKISMYKHPQT
jgi:hypothetical protein